MFEEKGWSTIAAFQTRNPMHRSHEYLAKIAIEIMDGVLIHRSWASSKHGDIPADVRAEAIDTLIEKYFVKDTCHVSAATRWRCVMPVRARRCCTRCSARTTAAAT